jgi:hypothetical protein
MQPFPADGYSGQSGTPRLPGPHDQFGYGGHSYPRPAMGQGQGKGGREMTPQRITTDEFSINTSKQLLNLLLEAMLVSTCVNKLSSAAILFY